MNIIIRSEQEQDYPLVEQITRDAFWDMHVPGCDEHYLAHILRQSACFVLELDLVAEIGAELVGNIMYSRAQLRFDDGKNWEVLSFGPLSVAPAWQGKGIGAALVRESLTRARQMSYPAVLIYGDPDYYSRFGFRAASHLRIRTRDSYYSPALMYLELNEGSLPAGGGAFWEDEVFTLDPEAVRLFDQGFPNRPKGFKSSQDRFQALLRASVPAFFS